MPTIKEYSRKWKLTVWAFWTLTALLVVPGVASFVLALLDFGVTLTLMTPELFITGVGLLVGLYGAANVVQKFTASTSSIVYTEDRGTGRGGQPENTDAA